MIKNDYVLQAYSLFLRACFIHSDDVRGSCTKKDVKQHFYFDKVYLLQLCF